MNWRPKLRTLFIGISLIALILPLASILVLRVYESALVRQTESNLIMQASWIISSYQERLKSTYPNLELKNYGNTLADSLQRKQKQYKHKWHPKPATIDLNENPVYSKPPDPQPGQILPDSFAYAIGQQLQPILIETQLTTLAGMRILDFHGTVVATTGQDLGYSLVNRSEVRQALQGHFVRVLRQRISDEPRPMLNSMSRGTNIRIFLAHPVIVDQRVVAVVILSRTPPDIFQVLYAKRQLFSYYGLLLLVLVILIAWLTSFSITRPIKALVNQAIKASEVDQENTMPPLAHPFIYEIDQLSQALNKMVLRQNQRANFIKNFASQVSHEFKTPISAIKGALEVLTDHRQDMSAQEIEQFLDNIDKDTGRMQKLMARLTQLAKADVVTVSHKSLDLLPVLIDLKEKYQSKIQITIEADSKDYPVLMAKELVESIFINLIENALQHGSTAMTIELNKSTQAIELMVRDNGNGISDNNADKIFNPFFTTTRKQGGTGLGLAIIKTLLQAHQGDIVLQRHQNGCTFKLTYTKLA